MPTRHSQTRSRSDEEWLQLPLLSDDMHFKIPLDPPVDLEITSDKATVVPTSPAVTSLSNATPGPIVDWKGSGSETSDNVTTYKIGKGKEEIDLPIRVKTMKKRTVKVAIHQVHQPGHRAVPKPEKASIEQKLNEIYGSQTNAWFVVTYKDMIESTYDSNGDGILNATSAEEQSFTNNPAYNDNAQDIIIFLVDDIVYRFGASKAWGYTYYGNRKSVVLTGSSLSTLPLLDQGIIHLIAHEIGHVMIGAGHPDDESGEGGGGPAPLDGTIKNKRMMCSGDNMTADSKILVKTEWDIIEEWLKNRPRGDN